MFLLMENHPRTFDCRCPACYFSSESYSESENFLGSSYGWTTPSLQFGYDSDGVFQDDYQYLSPGVFDGTRMRYDWDTDFAVLFKINHQRKPAAEVESWVEIGKDTLGSADVKPGTYERRGKHEPKHKKNKLVKKQIRAFNKKHPKPPVKKEKKLAFFDDDFF